MVNEKELKEELLIDDLEEAAGGIGVTPDPNKPSGMSCPACQGFIPVTPQQLITESVIVCPHCGQWLNVADLIK